MVEDEDGEADEALSTGSSSDLILLAVEATRVFQEGA